MDDCFVMDKRLLEFVILDAIAIYLDMNRE